MMHTAAGTVHHREGVSILSVAAERSGTMPGMQILDVLRATGAAELERLLTLRPDLLACPDLVSLAQTMTSSGSTRLAVDDLPAGPRQLLEALSLLPGDSTVAQLAELSAQPPPEPELASALDELRARFLLHPDLSVLRLVGPVRQLLPRPLGLGRSSYDCHEHTPFYELQLLAASYGLDRPRSREAGRRLIQEVLADTPALAASFADLPAPLLARLHQLDQQGPVVKAAGADPFRGLLPTDGELADLVVTGLLAVVGVGRLELPAEVGLGLRHPDLLRWELTTAVAPHQGISPDQVAAASGAGVQALFTLVDALAERIDQRPVPLLLSGGVGVKELRTLAKDLGELSAVATVLVLLDRLGLVSALRKDLRTTRLWPQWAGQGDAERWSDLVRAWQDGFAPPPPRPGSERKAKAALSYSAYDPRATRERQRLVRLLAAAPTDVSYAEAGWLARWQDRHPAGRLAASDPAGTVAEQELRADLLHEAELLALVAAGAATPLVRAVALGEDLEGVLADLATAGVSTLRAQADLTLVCTGVPSRQMGLDLGRLATVESAGAGTVWRISERSLAPAYDEGDTAEQVEATLLRYAGELPQGMSYLIKDAARRHGRVRVGAASSYVVVEDDGLLRDALMQKTAAGKALAALAVRRIAPGVAVSGGTVTETVEALRLAGVPAVADTVAGARPVGAKARRAAPAHQRALTVFPVRAGAHEVREAVARLT